MLDCTFGISRPCEGTCALRPVHCTGVDSHVPERVTSSPIQGWCDTPFKGRIGLVPGVPDGYASRIVAARPGVGARCTECPVSFLRGTWRGTCALRSHSVGNVRLWTVGRVVMVGANGTRLRDAASAGRAHASLYCRGGKGGRGASR